MHQAVLLSDHVHSELRRRSARLRFLRTLVLVTLLGYAIAGRGFAYLSIGPVYIGEIVLGLLATQFVLTRRAWLIFRSSWSPWLIVLLIAWGAIRTVPYFESFGIDAIRDSALFYYSLYAIVFAGLLVTIGDPIENLVHAYRKFASVFLFVGPVVVFLYNFAYPFLPVVPGTQTPFPSYKPGDMMVHASGVALFFLSGCGRASVAQLALLVLLVLANSLSRGGLVTFLTACTVCLLFRCRGTQWLSAVVFACVLALSGLAINLQMATGRTIGTSGMVARLESLTASEDPSLEGSRTWRLRWWDSILDYTIHGQYFWMGKGFGVNLADDDGFQVAADHSLRSPHNSHLTVLARTGVPGICLWAAVILSLLLSLARVYLASVSLNLQPWSNASLFLLCYLIAFLTNAAFDPSLESPMGGIWFWTIFGYAIALIYTWHRRMLQRARAAAAAIRAGHRFDRSSPNLSYPSPI